MTEPSWLAEQPKNPDLPLWTRAIVGEMLPGPISPLGWSLFWEPCARLGLRDALIERFGFDSDEIATVQPETIACFDGHVYLNASILRVWAQRTPGLEVEDVDLLLNVSDRPLPDHLDGDWQQPDRVTAGVLEQWLQWVMSSRNQTELSAAYEDSIEAVLQRPNRLPMTTKKLLDHAVSLQPLARRLFSQHLNQTLAATVGPRQISKFCKEVGQPAHRLRLLGNIGQIESTSPALVLWDLSRLVRSSAGLSRFFDNGLEGLDRVLRMSSQRDSIALVGGIDALISQVGFRGENEWDLASSTWDAVPDQLLAQIDILRRHDDSLGPVVEQSTDGAEREMVIDEVGAGLEESGRDLLDGAAASTVVFLRGRERSRSSVMRVLHEIRLAIRAIAVELVRQGSLPDRRDIWMLTATELQALIEGKLRSVEELVSLRHAEFEALGAKEPSASIQAVASAEKSASSLVWQSTPYRSTGQHSVGPIETGDILMGTPASPGIVEGPARIVRVEADLAHLKPGEIVVLASPLLAAVTCFSIAGAVISDFGGPLSHESVVAREFGTPMVAGVYRASQRISDGVVLNVDGLTGVVSVKSTEQV